MASYIVHSIEYAEIYHWLRKEHLIEDRMIHRITIRVLSLDTGPRVGWLAGG
jgi:hypothetical protein